MGKKKSHKKNTGWKPPKGARKYFSPASDDEFKEKHPIGYVFLVILGIIALLSPVVLYLCFVIPYDINSPWIMFGWLGGFIFGIGLFNFVGIIIKQYLGHWVSIIAFVLGSIFIWISLIQMGIL